MIEVIQPGFVEVKGQKEGAAVGSRLGDLDSGETKTRGQDQNQRQETDTLSGRCQNAGQVRM